jgi:hypothetical protein
MDDYKSFDIYHACSIEKKFIKTLICRDVEELLWNEDEYIESLLKSTASGKPLLPVYNDLKFLTS